MREKPTAYQLAITNGVVRDMLKLYKSGIRANTLSYEDGTRLGKQFSRQLIEESETFPYVNSAEINSVQIINEYPELLKRALLEYEELAK